MLKEVETHTAVGPDRCFILYQLAKHAISRIGDIAEIGVYRGGTARLLAKTTNKPVHIFDTFGGMPVTDKEKDLHCAGDFSDTSFQFVKKYLEDCTNLKIYPGFFPDTAGPITNLQFCFVHIDVDIFKSVHDCCEFFYSRTVSGGIMVFDDYGFLSCPAQNLRLINFSQISRNTHVTFRLVSAL